MLKEMGLDRKQIFYEKIRLMKRTLILLLIVVSVFRRGLQGSC